MKNLPFFIVLTLAILSNVIWGSLYWRGGFETRPELESSGLASRLTPVMDKGRTLPSAYEANEVKNTLSKHAARPIQICFNEWLKTNPQFKKGSLEIDWHIDTRGRVQKPEVVASSLEGINNCVLDTLASLEFPPPPVNRPVYISHTFRFKNEVPSK